MPATREQATGIKAQVRWMIRRDLGAVVEIDAASFDRPWGEDDYLRLLRRRNWIGNVAEHDGRVVGSCVYSLHDDRIILHRLAVAPDVRDAGIGKQMAMKLIGKLYPGKRERIELEIRETNLAGCLFFKACGFVAIDTLRDHFSDTGEDAYVLECYLDSIDSF